MAYPRRRPLSALLPLLVLASAATFQPAPPARAANMLVSYDEAARMGLERSWFAQAPVDPGRSRISTWFHYFDAIYCVSDSGIITAFNSETGAQLWTRRIGSTGVAAFGPDANEKYLALISGSTMYILDRASGRLQWSREVGGAPSTGPALSTEYAYVALATGRVEGYKLDDPKKQPWYYQSKGRTYLRPTTTGRVVSWPTSEGYLYVSRADDPGILFRLQTNDDIVTSPAEQDPYIYIASRDGYLYCMHELTGREHWRFATGYPVTSSPAIVGDHAYVASIEPTLHCVNSESGARLWSVSGASHFAAQGKERVYASDRYGNLIVLDSKTGSVLGELPTAEGMSTLVNDQTDRVYLVNDRGLVQCLHEIGAVEPTLYRKPAEIVAAEAKAAATPKKEEDANPFHNEEPGADATAPPAAEQPGAPADKPAEQPEAPADPNNPFG
jgi:outer membrane protein assembly factor BamB